MQEKIISTLKDLLGFKTYKENKEEFTKLFNYLKEKYHKFYIKEYSYNDKIAMVISNTEEKDLDLVFCTHIDVVYASDYSYKEDEVNIYGRGTIDMKASVAVVLNVLNDMETDKKIGIFITSDEETTGEGAEFLLEKYNPKFVIIPDGGTNFELVIEEKGMLQIELAITTKTAHAAQLFDGENAILELMKVYEKIVEKYKIPISHEEYITSVNLSKLNGGNSANQVPGNATMTLDIRYINQDKEEDILNFIKNINPKVEVKILMHNPCFTTDLNNENVKKYLKASEDVLDKKIKKVGCESTSDAIFFCLKNIPAVIMNPDGYYAHSPKEYVNKSSLEKLYKIYLKFIEEEM